MKKITKSLLYYILFTLFIFCFFLYARFPDKVVEHFILDTVASRYPQTLLSLGTAGLSFPPGLKMMNVAFGFKDNPEASINLESLNVRPRLSGYLTGNASFIIKSDAYGGYLEGRVDYPKLQPEKSPSHAEVKFEGLSLEKCSYLKEKLGRAVKGTLSGEIAYDGESKLAIAIQEGSYPLTTSFFGIDKLEFSRIEGKATLKGRLLKVDKLTLKGDKLGFSLKGNIALNPVFNNSEINLTGTVEVASLNNKKITLYITGILGSPNVRYQ